MAEKKLTDICDIQYGYPFDSSGFSSSAEDGMPLIRIRDVKDGHSETYFKGDFPEEYIIHKGDYLVGMDGEFNIAAWQSDDALLNQRVCRIASKCHNVSTHYLYRFLTKELKRIEDETPFVTVKHLSAKRLNQVYLNVPSLPEQERIVAELDLLTGIIDKQKAQLKELDTLAQSIFYDMLGDPESNEKGWECSRLGDLCNSDLGKTLNQAKDTGELRTYLCAINIKWQQIDLSTLKNARFEDDEIERYSVTKGDLLVCEGGDIGRSAIWDKDYDIQYQNALHRLRFNGKVTAQYCLFTLQCLKQRGVLDSKYGKGVTIKHLVKSSLLSIPIPVPPITLQQTFAQKIQSIESQKASINQSIAETQKLFDYTMDKYFG